MDTQKFAQGVGPFVRKIWGRAQDLCILSWPPWHSPVFRGRSYSFPQHMASRRHTTGSPTGSETDTEDPYIFMPHIKTPLSDFQIPKTSMMGESHSTGAAAAPGNKAMTTPCHPHKPSQVETPQQSCTSQNPVVRKKDRSVSFATTMPCHRDYQVVDSSHSHQGQCQAQLR
ncbi:GRB2-associated-binding protein 2 [Sciurus carolinensis]|uniref:GRB2-associated-binding protein 2 n=1 Tax=Sciurus carolinensis TaxID=30640 RepID=A0AA41MCF6_SCICA|nr:GRB2-associated-binding protein 2 [Sciurus carolinensis]